MRAKAIHELTAADVMRRGVVVPKEMTLRGAARLMAEGRVGAAAVTDARGRCAGLLLAAALVRWLADGRPAGPDPASVWSEWQMTVPEAGTGDEVRRHMNPEPLTVAPDTPLVEVGRRALGDPSRRAVVIDGQHRPLGVVSSADVLSAFLSAPRRLGGRDRAATAIREALASG
ncbi:MAG TPA: CBS domain-containing protein [Gemmataceae bacterium]|nr:CBS domain-containing protein [Gemmataceae bacterium]